MWREVFCGTTDADLQESPALQRKPQWRLDCIAADNAMGTPAPQLQVEAADSAQRQVEALKLQPR